MYRTLVGGVLLLYTDAVGVFFSPSRLGCLSGATTPSISWPGSNGNVGVLHIPQSSRTGATISDGLMSYPVHWCRDLSLCRYSVGVFYSQLGWIETETVIPVTYVNYEWSIHFAQNNHHRSQETYFNEFSLGRSITSMFLFNLGCYSSFNIFNFINFYPKDKSSISETGKKSYGAFFGEYGGCCSCIILCFTKKLLNKKISRLTS